ncbi:hypothetical protein ACKWTF_013214 [Chironomus riparius]
MDLKVFKRISKEEFQKKIKRLERFKIVHRTVKNSPQNYQKELRKSKMVSECLTLTKGLAVLLKKSQAHFGLKSSFLINYQNKCNHLNQRLPLIKNLLSESLSTKNSSRGAKSIFHTNESCMNLQLVN